MSAVCGYCNQHMEQGISCTLEEYDDFPDGIVRYRERFYLEDVAVCGDCNAPFGGFHHPGCDVERCPGCGGQAIGCNCLDAENEDWYW